MSGFTLLNLFPNLLGCVPTLKDRGETNALKNVNIGPAGGVVVKMPDPIWFTLLFKSQTWRLGNHARHMLVCAQNSQRRIEENACGLPSWG